MKSVQTVKDSEVSTRTEMTSSNQHASMETRLHTEAKRTSRGCPRADPRRGEAGVGCGESNGGGGATRVHSPRDMGKRNAEKRAAGACDLGDSLTTTGVFCLCTRSLSDACWPLARPAGEARGAQPELNPKQCLHSQDRIENSK